jgi:hypothetical protein
MRLSGTTHTRPGQQQRGRGDSNPTKTDRTATPQGEAAEERRDNRRHREKGPGPPLQAVQNGLLLGDSTQALLVSSLVTWVCWWAWQVLNLRPLPCEGGAAPLGNLAQPAPSPRRPSSATRCMEASWCRARSRVVRFLADFWHAPRAAWVAMKRHGCLRLACATRRGLPTSCLPVGRRQLTLRYREPTTRRVMAPQRRSGGRLPRLAAALAVFEPDPGHPVVHDTQSRHRQP